MPRFGGRSRLAREELREIAALVDGDAGLPKGVDEVAAVKVNRAHGREVDRVGLRPRVGSGAYRAMATNRVGPKLPFRPVVGAFQIRVRDERHQLRQVPHDAALGRATSAFSARSASVASVFRSPLIARALRSAVAGRPCAAVTRQ